MNDEAQLLHVCLANPFDIGPRGAYADHLMEFGEDDWARERGEFINWHIRFQEAHKEKSVRSKAAQDEKKEWSEKIWYLFSGRVPMKKYAARPSYRDDSYAAEIHTPIHNGGLVIVRNGMPEKVIMTCEQFMGPPRGTTRCNVCRGRGEIEKIEQPPFDSATLLSKHLAGDDQKSGMYTFRRFTVPCEHCGDGYAIHMAKRWPITEVQFTGVYDRVRNEADRCWEFGDEVIRDYEIYARPELNTTSSMNQWRATRFSQAAVNGMRGWAGLPKLKWPDPPPRPRPRDLLDAIDAARLAYQLRHAMQAPINLHGILNDVD